MRGDCLEIDAEIFLQDEGDGAAKARHAAFAGGVETGDRAAGQNLVPDFGFDHRSEAIPGAREIADYDQVAAGIRMFEPNGGEHAGVGGVFELHLDARGLHDGSAQIEIAPLEIGSEDQTVGALVEAAVEADADAFELL